MDQESTWYGGRPWPRPHCVRWGPSSRQNGAYNPRPQFSAHVCCGQAAGWIKIPFGTEVGLSPGDIVLDGEPDPRKRAQPPIFGLCLLWPNGWMDQDATSYGGIGLCPGHSVKCGPSSPRKGAQQSPSFGLMSVVAKLSPISFSATAELLLHRQTDRPRYSVRNSRP